VQVDRAAEIITDEIRAIWADMVDTMDGRHARLRPCRAADRHRPPQLAVVDCSDDAGAGDPAGEPAKSSMPRASSATHAEASPNLPGVSAVIRRPRAVTVAFLNATGALVEEGFRQPLGDVGPAPDRPSGGADVFRSPVCPEAQDADRQGRKAAGAKMKIVFMGTPDFSVPILQALAARHQIVCVYCQPPRPAGRGKQDRPSPVQTAAQALGLPVRHPASLRIATGAGGIRQPERRYRRGRGLWPDPAAGGA
jgi:hypothetical protein